MPRYKYTPEQLATMERNPWLTDRQRRVFELHYRRGWRIADIAAELDVRGKRAGKVCISSSTVARDLRRIRSYLNDI